MPRKATRRATLTSRSVLSLGAGGGVRRDYSDSVVPGLQLRVSATGARRYSVRYRRGDGWARWNLGDVANILSKSGKPDLGEVRRQARDILGRVARGEDPAGERDAARRARTENADTFQALAARLVSEAEIADTTRRSWLWVLQKKVFPVLGDRDPASITRGDVRELLAKIEARSVANDAFKVIRWVFARATEQDILEHSPCVGLRKPSKERPRDRTLTNAELRDIWTASADEGLYGSAVRLALLTGARRAEVFEAAWSELDRDARVWRLPAARMKGRRPHEVPLVADVEALLDDLQGLPVSSPWLFPGLDPKHSLRPASKPWARLLVSAGIIEDPEEAEDVEAGAGPHPVRFHDLRRTVRDRLAALGVALPVAEAVIGHAAPRLIATYNPSGIPLADRRRALERWQRELRRIVSGRAAKVVRIGT